MNPSDPDPVTEATWNEVRPILDAELDALPDEARRLLIACYLQGKTHAEAAAELGLPLGSLAWRLEKAQTLLAKRLVRRGVTVSAASVGRAAGRDGERGGSAGGAAGAYRGGSGDVYGTGGRRGFRQRRPVGEKRLGEHGERFDVLWLGVLSGLGGDGSGAARLLAPGAWPDQTPESEPPAARAAERPGQQENDHPLSPTATATRCRPARGPFGNRAAAAQRGGPIAGLHAGRQGAAHGGRRQPSPDCGTRPPASCCREFTNIPKPQAGNHIIGLRAILSPDGRILAVRSGPTGNLYLLETATGQTAARIPCETGYAGNGPPLNFAFSPDSKAIAAQFDDRLELRDVARGRTVWQTNEKYIGAVGRSPFLPTARPWPPRRMATACRLWDARTGKLLREIGPKYLLVHLAFSPDSRTLAVGCGSGVDRNQQRPFVGRGHGPESAATGRAGG